MPLTKNRRNSLLSVDSRERRKHNLENLLNKIVDVPDEFIEKLTPSRKGDFNLVECNSWEVLNDSWRKAMFWTSGLETSLAVMLASIASTNLVGDQLWVKILGPASCGKSTLCEAVSTNVEHVVAKSTIRGFHSGFRSDDGEDTSLLAQATNKTLVIKDGDTLLTSPNMPQILAEGRDVYDTVSRTHYRNAASRDYTGARMTWILCGTGSLKSIDSSELGERFLDCVIMDGIDDDLEDNILWTIALRSSQNLGREANGKRESQQDPKLTEAMALTGGYINYLRSSTAEKMQQVEMGTEALRLCTRLGKFVALFRARPSKQQREVQEREMAGRLVSQFTRLAGCTAFVFNESFVGHKALDIARKVALDTAKGSTLKIAKAMLEEEDKGVTPKALALQINMTEAETLNYLRFLRSIKVVRALRKKTKLQNRVRWHIRPEIKELLETLNVFA